MVDPWHGDFLVKVLALDPELQFSRQVSPVLARFVGRDDQDRNRGGRSLGAEERGADEGGEDREEPGESGHVLAAEVNVQVHFTGFSWIMETGCKSAVPVQRAAAAVVGIDLIADKVALGCGGEAAPDRTPNHFNRPSYS